mgnify:FL=1|jgi:hypothetical protein
MNNTNSKISAPLQLPSAAGDTTDEPFVTAEQASTALNLPLYYFLDARKRAALGIPYYSISRLVRYRLRELHKWQVRYAAEQAALAANQAKAPVGGAHA